MAVTVRATRVAAALALAAVCAPVRGQAGDQPVYQWYELEKLVASGRWLTSNLWAPSGGLFSYPLTDAPPANLTVEPGRMAQWSVWLRVRDETPGMRLALATVNGQKSYIMGGTEGGQWVWYQVGVVETDRLDLTLSHVRTRDQMDPWFDALLLTDDLSFVPPGMPPGEGGYTTYSPIEDAENGRRPAWTWWPAQPQPQTFAYFRRSFELGDVPASAQVSIACLGQYDVYLNGQNLGSGMQPIEVTEYEVTHLCRQGTNVLGFEVEHAGFLPGLWVHFIGQMPDGAELNVVSDLTWRANYTAVDAWLDAEFDDSAWHRPWARIGEREPIGFWDHEPPAE